MPDGGHHHPGCCECHGTVHVRAPADTAEGGGAVGPHVIQSEVREMKPRAGRSPPPFPLPKRPAVAGAQRSAVTNTELLSSLWRRPLRSAASTFTALDTFSLMTGYFMMPFAFLRAKVGGRAGRNPWPGIVCRGSAVLVPIPLSPEPQLPQPCQPLSHRASLECLLYPYVRRASRLTAHATVFDCGCMAGGGQSVREDVPAARWRRAGGAGPVDVVQRGHSRGDGTRAGRVPGGGAGRGYPHTHTHQHQHSREAPHALISGCIAHLYANAKRRTGISVFSRR